MSHPVPVADPVLTARLRADLRSAGFTVDRVTASLGPVASAALHRDRPEPALRATDGSTDPVHVLVRFLTLGRSVTAGELDAALPALGAHGAVTLGLALPAAPEQNSIELLAPTCDLRPYGDGERDWWLASDLSELATNEALETDHVLGVGGASTTLASWTIRRPVRRALDLGTGCGVQALHLSTHAASVVATDVSDRALAFARFNAVLNELAPEPDLRAGDLFAPVANDRFDLVVSNPPFVITPRVDGVPVYEYRDGGRAGDALMREVVGGIGSHLEPGGVAQFLGNWEIPAGRDWRSVWGGWLDGLGLDAWVVQRQVQDPAEYAELWARDGGARPGSPLYARLYAAWLDDFAARGTGSVGFGVVTLQRPTTDRAPFRHLDDEPGPVPAAMGATMLAGLEARTWLAERSDDDLLDVAWSLAPDVTEARYGRPGDTDPAVIELRQGAGFAHVVRADTVLAAYASVADGTLTARQALVAIAELLETDAADLLRAMAPVVRDLVAKGILR